MANWCGSCRSNYFKVKDRAAFENFLAQYEAQLIEGEDGRVGFYSTSEFGEVPYRWDDDEDHISILYEISSQLAEGEVCVIEEIGAEKLRYLTGKAWAISWEGVIVNVDIGEIYQRASEAFGVEPVQALY